MNTRFSHHVSSRARRFAGMSGILLLMAAFFATPRLEAQDLPGISSTGETLTSVGLVLAGFAAGVLLFRAPEPAMIAKDVHENGPSSLSVFQGSTEPVALRRSGFFNAFRSPATGTLSRVGSDEVVLNGRDGTRTLSTSDVHTVMDLESAAEIARVQRYRLAVGALGLAASNFYSASIQDHEIESTSRTVFNAFGAVFLGLAAYSAFIPSGVEKDYEAWQDGRAWSASPELVVREDGLLLGARVAW